MYSALLSTLKHSCWQSKLLCPDHGMGLISSSGFYAKHPTAARHWSRQCGCVHSALPVDIECVGCAILQVCVSGREKYVV